MIVKNILKKAFVFLVLSASFLTLNSQEACLLYTSGKLLYLEGEQKPYSGEVERKYPNGKLLGVATMKDGKLEGKAYEYFENGKVMREETYVNGAANGPAKSYYENGQVEYETNFKNSQREGIEKARCV